MRNQILKSSAMLLTGAIALVSAVASANTQSSGRVITNIPFGLTLGDQSLPAGIKTPPPLATNATSQINVTTQSVSEPVIPDAAPVKLYRDMTPEEQRKFVADEAQHVARMIGNPQGFALTDDAVSKIKFYVDAYARRLNSPRPSGGCNMRACLVAF